MRIYKNRSLGYSKDGISQGEKAAVIQDLVKEGHRLADLFQNCLSLLITTK